MLSTSSIVVSLVLYDGKRKTNLNELFNQNPGDSFIQVDLSIFDISFCSPFYILNNS